LIANRLSENPSVNVLLVEAGGDPVVLSSIVGLFGYLINSTSTWNYKHEVNKETCKAYKNGCNANVGKMLGEKRLSFRLNNDKAFET